MALHLRPSGQSWSLDKQKSPFYRHPLRPAPPRWRNSVCADPIPADVHHLELVRWLWRVETSFRHLAKTLCISVLYSVLVRKHTHRVSQFRLSPYPCSVHCNLLSSSAAENSHSLVILVLAFNNPWIETQSSSIERSFTKLPEWFRRFWLEGDWLRRSRRHQTKLYIVNMS